jgi:hypothetical protein
LDDSPLWLRKAVTDGLQAQRGRTSRAVLKQEVERKASLPQALQNALDEADAAPKPYDAETLRDLSTSPVPQTYVDTLAQDAASADWTLRPIDEAADVDAGRVARIERRLRNLVPDSTFPEFLEEWSRSILRLGDGTVVKHYPGGDPGNEVGEIVHVDSSTMFKRLDMDGYADGYVQMTAADDRNRTEFSATPLDLEEVVWVSWARRGNHVYGEGPVEKGRDTIEILEELLEKELLDLVQGMPPGVLSRPPDTEAAIDAEDWENFKDDMRLQRGERHRLAFTKFPVDYTALTPNYQELQLLERYKSKVTELGGVFKVNPSYAGFEFENVNRATDESQQLAYKQRGFQVLISRLEAALTFGVIPDMDVELGLDLDTPDDMDLPELRFEFERERTTAEKRTRANYITDAVNAGKEAADAGLDVRWKDGQPVIADGAMEAGNAGGGGGGGGLFGSADTDDELVEAYMKATGRDDVHVLGFPMGGVAHSGDGETWARFMNALLDRGAEKIVDLKAERNGRTREYPADALPGDHDPLVAVHGLPKNIVTAVLQRFEEVHLQMLNTGKRREAGDGGNADRDGETDAPSPLSKDEIDTLDELLFQAHTEQIFPASADEIEKRVFSSSDVPDYVLDKIREALDDGAVFDAIETAGDTVNEAKTAVEDILEDNLLDEDGWSLREIRDDIQGTFGDLSEEEAERIARTETSSTLNTAREKGYEERDDAGSLVFEWVGPSDSRTTMACEFMKDGSAAVEDAAFAFDGTQTQPLSMAELKAVQNRVADYYFPSLTWREHVLHPDERHTFKRVIPGVSAAAEFPGSAGVSVEGVV